MSSNQESTPAKGSAAETAPPATRFASEEEIPKTIKYETLRSFLKTTFGEGSFEIDVRWRLTDTLVCVLTDLTSRPFRTRATTSFERLGNSSCERSCSAGMLLLVLGAMKVVVLVDWKQANGEITAASSVGCQERAAGSEVLGDSTASEL
jgi:hypothetical protein